jgi:hypothetical protein
MRSFFRPLALCLIAIFMLSAQNTTTGPAHPNETKGMPPRSSPGDYPAHVEVGNLTLAAEFTGHSVPRPDGPLSTDDYVVVEAAVFGPPEARLVLSPEDFSLRINDKKTQTSAPFVLVARSLRDPEWTPPEQKKSKPKTSFGGGGGGEDTSTLPPKIPFEMQRSMAQYIQKAALPEGERPLPIAGLLFFQYRGKTQAIRSLELTYTGPAGKATLPLQP